MVQTWFKHIQKCCFDNGKLPNWRQGAHVGLRRHWPYRHSCWEKTAAKRVGCLHRPAYGSNRSFENREPCMPQSPACWGMVLSQNKCACWGMDIHLILGASAVTISNFGYFCEAVEGSRWSLGISAFNMTHMCGYIYIYESICIHRQVLGPSSHPMIDPK